MTKIDENCEWKPVHIDGPLPANGLEGLIGIEECTNYSDIITAKNRKRKLGQFVLNTTAKKSTKKIKKKEKSAELAPSDFTPSKSGSTNQDYKSEIINQEEPNQELLAWSNFGLHSSLLKAIKDQGFESPTQIQSLSLPPAILGQRDILGAAETGSGKTLAFGLPILNGIIKIKESNQDSEGDKKPLYALILTPTRELAVQITKHLTAAAKYTDIKVAVIVGGMAAVKQERILSKGPDIVVATPGRLWELIQGGNPHLSQIDYIRFLVIDETDRMLEKDHFQELHDLFERLNFDEEQCKQRQNFVFSATLTMVHELPKYLRIKKRFKPRLGKNISKLTPEQKLQQIIEVLGITKPKIVDVTRQAGLAETLTECRITCAFEEKDYYVYYFLLQHPGRTLIFCNSIGCVKRLTTLLGLLDCNPLPLHASMQQRQRLKNLDKFRENDRAILIATDVAARGLDIPCIEHVIHYQTPRTSEAYVHRSGRTARAFREGITVLLVEPAELQNYFKLCKTLGRTEDLPQFPVQQRIFGGVKERVKLARELDHLELEVKKARAENGWVQKAAEEMDIIVDVAIKHDMEDGNKCKKAADVKRKQLASLLSKPIVPKGFSGKYPLISTGIDFGALLGAPKQENAVEAMKNAMKESSKMERKKAKWMFKPKSWKEKKVDQVNHHKQKKNKSRKQ